MPYYPYSRVVPDSSIPFTSIGLRHLEQTALLDAFGKPGLPLDPDQEEWLKHMTGCQTFLEFRERIFSPHHLVSHDHSLLLIEEVLRRGGRRPVETLMFRALLMSTAGECIALVRRRLNRHDGVVDHNMLEVRPEFGGKGVGSVVAQSHEDAWHAAGFRQVALTAGELDRGTMEFGTVKFDHGHTRRDGRVFWAKQGFDFHRTRGRTRVGTEVPAKGAGRGTPRSCPGRAGV